MDDNSHMQKPNYQNNNNNFKQQNFNAPPNNPLMNGGIGQAQNQNQYKNQQNMHRPNNNRPNNHNNYNNNNGNYDGIEDYKPYNGPLKGVYNKIVEPPTGIFKNKDIRQKFISKVLKIIATQFLLTTLFCLASVFSDSYQDFLADNYFILILAVIVSLICCIALYCFRNQARKTPNNYILLFVFTLCESYSLSYICAFTEPGTVLLAAGITFLLVVCLTTYAITTKRDITQKANLIFYAFIAVFVLAIGALFFRSHMLNVVIAVAFLLVFSAFLVLDIQRLQGNRKFAYDIDDYIIAALDIYIDIIVMFKQLLYLLGN
ncbi:hypothetical protein PPERSA_05516 [Pseudocohnilembus persalinus]|uniref:Bax inhibitor 1-related n=1 Tax=Pseudocohnilembus persalinus TaxID=266149 RepID=A0A0V0QCQ2_PSEPJ|nr:hypothetical protein PPERSA_05516 [Pseudocohnilembus persalinus]|eukprot:KRX00014.1 hypothetical protein PPERSA_05516 [Pseudocohnilembus persalinus]